MRNSAIDKIVNFPVQEMTGTCSIATGAMAPAMVMQPPGTKPTKSRKSKLADLLLRKKLSQGR